MKSRRRSAVLQGYFMVGALLSVWFLTVPGLRARDFKISGYSHRTIWLGSRHTHELSYPGALLMPDGSIMVNFYQMISSDPTRPVAPPDVKNGLLTWADQADQGEVSVLDSTGSDSRNVYIRSWNGGRTWKKWSQDFFESAIGPAIGNETEAVLPNGTILRGAWGQYLPYNPEIPKTGYLQRSTDGGKTWGKPELLLDPKKYTAWPKRLRILKDGRILCLGGISHAPAGSKTLLQYVQEHLEPILQVSGDDGHTWSEPLEVVPPQYRTGWVNFEEWDAAELANGDLFCIFRRGTIPDPKSPWKDKRSIWQGTLAKKGNTWLPLQEAPLLKWPDSGYPDLLMLKEGIILYSNMAQTAHWADNAGESVPGARWTVDAGKTWHDLPEVDTGYYPRAIQAPDGRVYIFSFNLKGAKLIFMDTFSLVKR